MYKNCVYQLTDIFPFTMVWHAKRFEDLISSLDKSFSSFFVNLLVLFIPLSILQIHVPHIPPPHLKGMPILYFMDALNRLVSSSVVII